MSASSRPSIIWSRIFLLVQSLEQNYMFSQVLEETQENRQMILRLVVCVFTEVLSLYGLVNMAIYVTFYAANDGINFLTFRFG